MNISDVKEFVTLPNGLVTVVAKPCEVPPEGWACSRDRGHKGPCAATQDVSLLPIFEAYVKGLQIEPKNLCKSCGTNLDFNQCFCNSTVTHPIKANSVAIIKRCELGEHCRCAIGDHADCWNWIGEVKL